MNISDLENVTWFNNSIFVEEFLTEIKEYIFPKGWTWVIIFLHIFVFLVGATGNILVCIAVYRNHGMRTVTNYFIVNLAVADFLVIVWCLPPTVIWDVTSTWFLGNKMCKIVIYLQNVSVIVSVLTLTFISIERWYAICFPLKFKSTTNRVKTAIGIIWIFALLFDIPEVLVYRSVPDETLPFKTIFFTQCEPSWSIKTDTIWTVAKIILFYAFPLILMTAAYLRVIRVLWDPGSVNSTVDREERRVPRNCSTLPIRINDVGSYRQIRSRKKAAKMLVAVVIMFAVCYLPVHLLCILRLTMEMTNSELNRAFFLISHWLCYANSAVNPIIYNFMSGKFRKEFHRAFECCFQPSAARVERALLTRRPNTNEDNVLLFSRGFSQSSKRKTNTSTKLDTIELHIMNMQSTPRSRTTTV